MIRPDINVACTGCSRLPARSPSTTAIFKVYSPGGSAAPPVNCSGDGTPSIIGFNRAVAAWLSMMRPSLSVNM